MKRLSILLIVLLLASNLRVRADEPRADESIAEIGHRWAAIYYVTPDAQKDAAYGDLLARTQQLAAAFPNQPEPLIWQAIVLSSAAKVEGGFGALRKAKEARELLTHAEAINPAAMNGSIYASLGSLYAKVPGWPIGFGDKAKAKAYLEKALTIDPAGIDANYFYADFLADQGEYAKAAGYLKNAIAAPARPGREDADSGRRQEAEHLLAMLKQKHADQLASN